MDFRLEFYETPSGKCPVREFLDELKLSDPDDFAAVVAGLTTASITARRCPKRSARDYLNCATSRSSTLVCCGFS